MEILMEGWLCRPKESCSCCFPIFKTRFEHKYCVLVRDGRHVTLLEYPDDTKDQFSEAYFIDEDSVVENSDYLSDGNQPTKYGFSVRCGMSQTFFFVDPRSFDDGKEQRDKWVDEILRANGNLTVALAEFISPGDSM